MIITNNSDWVQFGYSWWISGNNEVAIKVWHSGNESLIEVFDTRECVWWVVLEPVPNDVHQIINASNDAFTRTNKIISNITDATWEEIGFLWKTRAATNVGSDIMGLSNVWSALDHAFIDGKAGNLRHEGGYIYRKFGNWGLRCERVLCPQPPDSNGCLTSETKNQIFNMLKRGDVQEVEVWCDSLQLMGYYGRKQR